MAASAVLQSVLWRYLLIDDGGGGAVPTPLTAAAGSCERTGSGCSLSTSCVSPR